MPATSDPDRLVWFLKGSDADNTAGSRRAPVDDYDHTPRNSRATGIFDCLARLLVHDRGQVFAVAVVPDTQQARYIIAENTAVTNRIQEYLRDTVLRSLYETRKLVLAYPGAQASSPPPGLVIPTPIPRDTTDPVHRKLLELEVSVFRHSWPKIRKRFTKADRDVVFVDICSAILSPDPEKRLPPDVLEEDGLSVLSPSDRQQLIHIRHIVSEIRVLLVPSTAPSDEGIHRMRVLTAGMAKLRQDMQDRKMPGPLLPKFASYARTSRRPFTTAISL